MAVGIFDSGLGGLTVYDAIRRQLPDMPLVYYCDNAHAPYGERRVVDITRLTISATHKLWQAGCDLVIIACNTASAIALRQMQTHELPAGKHVLGVFVPMIETMTERDWGDSSPPRQVSIQQVALFATAATVASRSFQRELSYRAIGVDVEAQPCRGLVEAIEAGDQALAQTLIERYVVALQERMPQPQVAVLGCTHYPLMQHVFQRVLGPDVRIDSQAEVVAASLKNYLIRHPDRVGRGLSSRFYCSGEMIKTAQLASKILRSELHFAQL